MSSKWETCKVCGTKNAVRPALFVVVRNSIMATLTMNMCYPPTANTEPLGRGEQKECWV